MFEKAPTAGEIRQNLRDAGMTDWEAEALLPVLLRGDREAGLRLLARQREALLARIHQRQKELERLRVLLAEGQR